MKPIIDAEAIEQFRLIMWIAKVQRIWIKLLQAEAQGDYRKKDKLFLALAKEFRVNIKVVKP